MLATGKSSLLLACRVASCFSKACWVCVRYIFVNACRLMQICTNLNHLSAQSQAGSAFWPPNLHLIKLPRNDHMNVYFLLEQFMKL
jgi:hypothetical protein